MFKQIALPYFLLPLLLAPPFMGRPGIRCRFHPAGERDRYPSGERRGRLAWQNIILQSRFPQAVTALLAGASLATSGLLLQTLFRNPLAGVLPSWGSATGQTWELRPSCSISAGRSVW